MLESMKQSGGSVAGMGGLPGQRAKSGELERMVKEMVNQVGGGGRGRFQENGDTDAGSVL